MKKLILFTLVISFICFESYSSGGPEKPGGDNPCKNNECDPPDPPEGPGGCANCLDFGFIPVPTLGGSFDKGKYIFYIGSSNNPSKIPSGSIINQIQQVFQSTNNEIHQSENGDHNNQVGPYQVLTFGHWSVGAGMGLTVGATNLGTGATVSMSLSRSKSYEASRVVNTYKEAKDLKTFTAFPNTAKKFEKLPNKTMIMTSVKGQISFMLGAMAGFVASAGVDTDISTTHWLLRMEKPNSTTALLSFTHVKTDAKIGAKGTLAVASAGARRSSNRLSNWVRKIPNPFSAIKRRFKKQPTKAEAIDSHPGDRTVYIFQVDLTDKSGREAYDQIFKGNFYEAQALAKNRKGIILISPKNPNYKKFMSKITSLERAVQNTKKSNTINRGSVFIPVIYNRRSSRDIDIVTEDVEFLNPKFQKSFGVDLPAGTILHTLRGSTQSKKTSGGIISNHFNKVKKFNVKWENLEVPVVTDLGTDRKSYRRVTFEYMYSFVGEEWTADKFEEELQSMSKKIGYKGILQKKVINPLGGSSKSLNNIKLGRGFNINKSGLETLAARSKNETDFEEKAKKESHELINKWMIEHQKYRDVCPLHLSGNQQKCKKYLVEKTDYAVKRTVHYLQKIQTLYEKIKSGTHVKKDYLLKQYKKLGNQFSKNIFSIQTFLKTKLIAKNKLKRIDTVRFQADLTMDEGSMIELAKKSNLGLENELNSEASRLINEWFKNYPEDYDEICPGGVGLIFRAKNCKNKIIKKTKRYVRDGVKYLKEINKLHNFEGRGNDIKNEKLMDLYLKFGREFSKSQFSIGAFVGTLKKIKTSQKGNFLFCLNYLSSVSKPEKIVLEAARRTDKFVCTLPQEKDVSRISNVRDSDFFDEGARIDMSTELDF